MNEIKQQHVDYLADQVRRLINGNSAEIMEAFEGSADELLASPDPYLKDYLQKTLPPW